MDITAIIAEYNPFHNGHAYHIAKTKELFPTTKVVCIMSGEFVQRGEPSIAQSHQRATWAIKAGASACLKLPLWSSFSDGENFAKSGVKVAKLIGANRLCFGSECGDISLLKEIAKILDEFSPDFQKEFQVNMQKGFNYPTSICNTFKKLYPTKEYSSVLSNPNDILGVLYIRALNGSSIEPVCIKREDNGYNSNTPCGKFLSASSIRSLGVKNAKDYLPDYVYNDINSVDFEKELSSIALYKLKAISNSELENIQDVTEGLNNRIKKYVYESNTLDELLAKVKTKRYTMARLKRIVLFSLLEVSKEKFKQMDKVDYVKLLAINKEEKELLSYLATRGALIKQGDLTQSQLEFWQEENKISDLHSVLLHKTAIRNTIFV